MPSDPAALLTLARNELDGKRIQSAIAVLDRYQSLFPHGNDEVLFLYALAYEQDTPFKNVRKAYEYYKRVRDEYPRSLRWRQAADRMAYLERHFFGLR
jgi:outer membrane protein assembly factor BamD (BamD/ComL family)